MCMFADSPTVYFITPTYRRPSQKPDLIRVAQSLLSAEVPVHWLVVEDANSTSPWISELLETLGLSYTHLYLQGLGGCKGNKGRVQRNRALEWVKQNATDNGVIYFGDDDNSYHYKLFKEVLLIIFAASTTILVGNYLILSNTCISLNFSWLASSTQKTYMLFQTNLYSKGYILATNCCRKVGQLFRKKIYLITS